MNLRIAPTDTSFCKLSRPSKSSCCFQKIVQLFNVIQIMLLAWLINASGRKPGKQQLEVVFQLEIIKDICLTKDVNELIFWV